MSGRWVLIAAAAILSCGNDPAPADGAGGSVGTTPEVDAGSLPSVAGNGSSIVAEQAVLLATHVQDPQTGLLRHAWDEDRNALWADPQTGVSPEVWGRALGWYSMALVDMLGFLPSTHARRAELLSILDSLAAGLAETQDSSGLWYQVVDKGSLADNWLETSASAMFVYTLDLAVERGYLDGSYQSVADAAFDGLLDTGALALGVDGLPTVTGAVRGMGVQTSYSGYVSQQRLTNSPHGLCGVLLATAQVEKN